MPPQTAKVRELFSTARYVCAQCRHIHIRPAKAVPLTRPFVPDTQAFLTLIGRGMSQFATKIPSWEALFTYTSEQLKEAGIEPARQRRYLLWWRDRYRNGLMGVGADLKHVKDGVAELRVVQVPSKRHIDQRATMTKDAGMRKMVVNLPVQAPQPQDEITETPSQSEDETTQKVPSMKDLIAPMTIRVGQASQIAGYTIVQGNTIAGKGIEYVKGEIGVARLKVQEGLWEQRRGHKVDGGERRKAEVRFKRRQQEKKNAPR